MLDLEGMNACCLYDFITSEVQLFADHFLGIPLCGPVNCREATRIIQPDAGSKRVPIMI
jgi:hypothetical protein